MAITAGSDILASDFVSTAAGAGDSGKVPKLDAFGKILDAFTYKQYVTQTANGDIAANDAVYPTAANTVKSLYPTDKGTGTTITTSPSHAASQKQMPLSTSGLFLHVVGGDGGSSGNSVLYAQVRSINAAETDFSNGSEATIYSTSNGVHFFDICQISTDKFLIIYQTNTSGSPVGIKAVVITVSGTTITVGTAVTIETTGALARQVACATVDTDKGAIFYQKDSDSDLYVQILTVSGTTITTNTAVLVKAMTNACSVVAGQLATNSVLVLYTENSTSSNIYAKTVTVSGTTPTVNAEQTLVAVSSNRTLGLAIASSTKALMCYSESGTPTNDQVCILTISGATVTKGSNLALGSNRNDFTYFGMVTIGTKYAMVGKVTTNTTYSVYFLDITGATPTSVSSESFGMSSTAGIHNSVSIVKVSPWTYVAISAQGDSDVLIKLTPSSTIKSGVANAAIANAATGTILHRYRTHTLSGITLTPASTYYVDDTGQPTTKSSLTSQIYGVALSTTDMLIQ